MNLILEFLKFIIFSLGIVIISKYMLVPVLRKISIALKLSPKASGNIAGFATSVPELLTVSFSAASGLIGTSVYNILSSNIINLIQSWIWHFLESKRLMSRLQSDFQPLIDW